MLSVDLPAPSFLRPPRTAPRVIEPKGIARLAAQSDQAEERNQVDYRWIDCRKTLNSVKGTRARFSWSINPYRGCEFGCAYCYARYTHEFMELDPLDFERIIYIKRDAAEKLKRELSRNDRLRGEIIAIGAATDPYQPAEKRFGITQTILKTLAGFTGFRIEITTKSALILRDIDLLRRLEGRHEVSVNMSIVTTDSHLQRRLEPRAMTPSRRFEAVRQLNAAGIQCGVFLMPIMPGINDTEDSIEGVVRAAKEAGAAFVAHNTLWLTSASRKRFDQFIDEEFPHLKPIYRKYYGGATDAPHEYKERIKRSVERMKKRAGFEDRRGARNLKEEWLEGDAAQMELF